MKMWRKIKPYCLLVTLWGNGCAFMSDDAAKKPAANLIATPTSYYSTAKARYLGTRYKDNLDRLAERIVRNSKTSQLQFANNISSVGGIGFFTHSATKTPDERYLEVVLAAPETFETKGEYSEKVNQLFSRYGQELLAILAGDNEIFQDKELAGYGLNLAWRNVVAETPTNRVTLARAIIYLPKERVQSFLRRGVSHSDLLKEAVIFAVEDNGPLNLVSFQPREVKPDFRPAIREDNLTAGAPPATAPAAAPVVTETAKATIQKPPAKIEPAKKEASAPASQSLSNSKSAAAATKNETAPVAPVAPKSPPPQVAEKAVVPEVRPVPAKREEKVPQLALAQPALESQSVKPVPPVPLIQQPLKSAEPVAKTESSLATGQSKARDEAAKVETIKVPPSDPAPAPRPFEAATQKPAEAKVSRGPSKQTDEAPKLLPAKPAIELASKPAEAKPEAPKPTEIEASPAPVVDRAASPAMEKKAAAAPVAAAESRKQAMEAPKPIEAPKPVEDAAPRKEMPPAAEKPAAAKAPNAAQPAAGPRTEIALAPPVKSPAAPTEARPVEVKPAETVKAPVEVKKIEPQKRVAIEPAAAKTEPAPVVTSAPEPVKRAEVKPPEPVRPPAEKTAQPLPKAEPVPAPPPVVAASKAPEPMKPPAAAPVVKPEKAAPEPEQLALLKKPAEPSIEAPPVARPAPKPLQGFIIQVAFNDKEKAQSWAEKMTRRGYAVSVTEAGAEGALRVRLGNFAVRDEAERQLQSFKQEGMSGIIINLPQAFRPEARSSLP